MCVVFEYPYVGWCDAIFWREIRFLLEKSLSVKVLINKDNFGFVNGFLVR